MPSWPADRRRTTFGHLLVRVTADTAQHAGHAGHADIVRELIDGRGGRDHSDLGAEEWSAYVDRVRSTAETFR